MDSTQTLSVITDPIIPIQSGGAITRVTLPEAMARLTADTVDGFPGLAAHQRQPWFQFLVQLGAIALRRGRVAHPPADATSWAALLNALAPAPAWCLVVDDPGLPALLQPPEPSGSLDGHRPIGACADDIDVLITAKNHDTKRASIFPSEPHHWLYALVALQTIQGFLGSGNYGVARMNGGFGSRMMAETIDSQRWGRRWTRGLLVAARAYRDVGSRPAPHDQEGIALLWLEPWDGTRSLGLGRLDLLFIEVCRRVRLIRVPDGTIRAAGASSKTTRVDAKDLKGVVFDLWMPVRKHGGSPTAFTVGGGGFRYETVAAILLDEEVEPPPALLPLDGDDHGALSVHLSVLVRGQGTTDGIHDRVVPIRKAVLSDRVERRRVHGIAKAMVQDCAEGGKKALRVGLAVLVQGGPEDLDFKDKRVQGAGDDLDARIDAIFFGHLWSIAEAGASDDVRREWQRALAREAWAVFRSWTALLPVPMARRERAAARATAVFAGIMFKQLALLKPGPGPLQEESTKLPELAEMEEE